MTSQFLDHRFLYISSRALTLSVVFHLAIPLMLLLGSVLDMDSFSIFGPRERRDKKVENFVQVDIVALPDLTVQELQQVDTSLPVVDNAKPAPIPKVEPVVKEDPDLMVLEEKKKADEAAKKKAEEEKKAQEKKKAEAEKKEAAEKKAFEEKRAAAMAAIAAEADRAKALEATREALKGNLKSEGTDITGRVGSAKDKFEALIAATIKKHFNLFPWQHRKDLIAVVQLDFNRLGTLEEVKVIEASQDPSYDRAVLRAINRAKKDFPVPEDRALLEGGIEIKFTPREEK